MLNFYSYEVIGTVSLCTSFFKSKFYLRKFSLGILKVLHKQHFTFFSGGGGKKKRKRKNDHQFKHGQFVIVFFFFEKYTEILRKALKKADSNKW